MKFTRRSFLGTAVSSIFCPMTASAMASQGSATSTIAFGSCCKLSKPQGIWQAIADCRPDLFVSLGDIVYSEKEDVVEIGEEGALDRAFERMSGSAPFERFRSTVRTIATWDDHDYGPHDSGGDYGFKQSSRARFLKFWRVPAGDIRYTQSGGIYSAFEIASLQRTIQILLLDTRYARTPLLKMPESEAIAARTAGMGPYMPNMSPEAQLLDEGQWSWLAGQMRRHADLRLICSSIPFSQSYRGWENWANFPLERQKMIDLLARAQARGVLFLSGDSHYAEISCEQGDGVPYPLFDFTSSGLTHFWPTPGPNKNRAGRTTVHAPNFGLVRVYWGSNDFKIDLEARDNDGNVLLRHELNSGELAPN